MIQSRRCLDYERFALDRWQGQLPQVQRHAGHCGSWLASDEAGTALATHSLLDGIELRVLKD
ncbi:protein of unknown function [Pseudomonas sp. JV241A]|nr:protein of unknown function [Pseudomonas sp. JV241A]